MQEHDNDLVQRYLVGDEEAFYSLVGKYKNPITNFIARIIGDYDQAVDLTQETFLRVYKSIKKYRSDYQFSTWIYRIASNLAIDELRRRKRRGMFERRRIVQEEKDREINPEEQVADNRRPQDEQCVDSQHRKLIQEAIQSLPPVYRTAFILNAVEEVDYDQISRILGCSLGTVKSRLHRAKSLLQKKLAPYWKKI